MESYRKGKKVLHRKLLYLGKLEGLSKSQQILLIDRLESLLLHRYEGRCEDEAVESHARMYLSKLYSRLESSIDLPIEDQYSASDLVRGDEASELDLSSFMPLRVREVGGEWMCLQAIKDLGIIEFLVEERGWSVEEGNHVLMNLQGRLLYPVSESKTQKWLTEQSGASDFLEGPDSIKAGHLYRSALNLLEEREALEDYLYNRLDELLDFGNPRYLYDLTNTYFEGRMQGSDLARYGCSKERRSDCPLVSVGLLANELGFIRQSYFYSGNISEPGTFKNILGHLKNSNGLLSDAGIATTENIEDLARQGIGYMCVVSSSFSEYQIDFDQAVKFNHKSSDGGEYQLSLKVEEHFFQVDHQHFKDWLIFVKSQRKAAKEDAMVAKQKKRMQNGLLQIQQSLSKTRGHKKLEQVHQRIGRLKAKNSRVSKAFEFHIKDNGTNVTELTWTYDSRHERRNGTYVIRTSEPVEDAQAAWKLYHTLTTIEGINRCCKTDLNMRPIYHQKDESIQAHLFLTLLACNIVTYIRYLLKRKNITYSWKEIVRIMSTQKSILSECKNKKSELFVLYNWSYPERKALEIYKNLGYKTHQSPGFFFKVHNHDP